MWNPDLDVEKLIDDYCRKGFGKAAVKVKEYYNELEKLTDKVASQSWNWRRQTLRGLPSIYTPAAINKLKNILVEAQKEVTGIEAKRIDFLLEGLKYTEVIANVLKAKTQKLPEPQIEAAQKARRMFFLNQKYPLSVAYPADMFWRKYNPHEL